RVNLEPPLPAQRPRLILMEAHHTMRDDLKIMERWLFAPDVKDARAWRARGFHGGVGGIDRLEAIDGKTVPVEIRLQRAERCAPHALAIVGHRPGATGPFAGDGYGA